MKLPIPLHHLPSPHSNKWPIITLALFVTSGVIVFGVLAIAYNLLKP